MVRSPNDLLTPLMSATSYSRRLPNRRAEVQFTRQIVDQPGPVQTHLLQEAGAASLRVRCGGDGLVEGVGLGL